MILFMPPLLKSLQHQATCLCRMDEVREMVHKRLDFGGGLIMFKPGLCPLILPKRVELANKEVSIRHQNPSSFCENE